MTLQVGQEVGNYRILQRLGAGGMGEVFLAEHPLIGKTVALKVIHQDMSLNKELVTRFVNEAKVVSSIGNDHIVDVHDFGTTPEGANFFIMEYLQGQTLARALSDGWLSVSDPNHIANCLHIGAQVASGLAAAHRQNIIHRDLKPDNIMLIEKLGDPFFVKILDFGLAKILEADAEKLTAMGVVLGTPEFMSPEAAESKNIDARSDIYSFGVLLFFMLTGRLPFLGKGMGEMMVQHVCQAPPPPRSINPQIPPAVEQIVLRCLAKNQDDRFQSMEELRMALMAPEDYLSGGPRIVASDGSPARPVAHPDMRRPEPAIYGTMNIGTPLGYARSGKRRMATLIAVALVSGGSGVAAALVTGQGHADSGGSHEEAKVDSAEPESSVTATAAEPKASTAEPGVSGDAAPRAANPAEGPAGPISVRITSDPEGATVTNADGATIGTTPFVWEGTPNGSELTWLFTRDGYSPMTYRFLPTSEEDVSVSLLAGEGNASRTASKNGGKRPRPGKKKPAKVNNNLLMPEL